MGLDKLTKTFDLKENKKGFFPHLFNTKENLNYVGHFPEKEFYQPRFMTESKKIEFDDWYSKASVDKNGGKANFNFKKDTTQNKLSKRNHDVLNDDASWLESKIKKLTEKKVILTVSRNPL